MCAEPFDEHNAAAVIDGRHQTVIVPFNVEDYPLSAQDACASVALFYLG